MIKSPALDPEKFKHALICDVWRKADGFDYSKNGCTKQFDQVLLVGPEIQGPYNIEKDIDEPIVNYPILYLHHLYTIKGLSYYASPDPTNGVTYMFGGNFIYSPDSRYPFPYAIQVHDRR